ncbi:MAG: hypothetical protein WCR98_08625 [Saccharofermentanales bacterium]
MFKYAKYTPITDEYTTHIFLDAGEDTKINRFDVPYVSIECNTQADFDSLMSIQSTVINATEITQAEFAEAVKESAQVKRMYDVANEQYVKECESIKSKYTQEEIDTWPVQMAEAEAVKAGTATLTPYLDALAADDGITLTAAADKILSLRDENAAKTTAALGRKWQKLKELKAEVGL